MQIKQDPITGLWCRSDGAVLMPPSRRGGMRYRWTFGSSDKYGYRQIQFRGKHYRVHRLVCRAFHGLPPADKPEVDHINRIRDDNSPVNLRYVNHKENAGNQGRVDRALEKYGARCCADKKAYDKAYHKGYDAAYRAKMKAQGLTFHKGPTGKWGWFPRIRT